MSGLKQNRYWKDSAFAGSFVASARIRSSLGLLEASLNELPALKERSRGTRLTYAVLEIEEGKPQNHGKMVFGKDSVAYFYNVGDRDDRGHAVELAKFISMLAYVDDFYDITLKSIYGYLVEGLSRVKYDSYDAARREALVERVNTLAGINLNLSHELVRLRYENALLGQRKGAYEKGLRDVLDWADNSVPGHSKEVRILLGLVTGETDVKRRLDGH